MGQLKGKTALVTGASRGIGRAIALRLAKDGANVVVNYASNTEKAEELVRTLATLDRRAVAVRGDMAKVADIRALFDEAERAFERLDIVVANAAIGLFKPTLEVTEEDFDRVFALNTRGAFFVLQQAAKRVRDGGRIVLVSTGGTARVVPGAGLYAGSKSATETFALALAKELGARQVTVNIVSPGAVETDALCMPKEMIARTISMTPLGRLGQPEDIADVVGFLASSDARWLSGQNVRPTGGLL
ncbi:SDR family oxidoreductase [Archangium sp.]|uniref:SDR family oxidoreductase n=1 Tax=Archangium sp. TaxID=1872627 RepID=UPI002EDB5A02